MSKLADVLLVVAPIKSFRSKRQQVTHIGSSLTFYFRQADRQAHRQTGTQADRPTWAKTTSLAKVITFGQICFLSNTFSGCHPTMFDGYFMFSHHQPSLTVSQ